MLPADPRPSFSYLFTSSLPTCLFLPIIPFSFFLYCPFITIHFLFNFFLPFLRYSFSSLNNSLLPTIPYFYLFFLPFLPIPPYSLLSSLFLPFSPYYNFLFIHFRHFLPIPPIFILLSSFLFQLLLVLLLFSFLLAYFSLFLHSFLFLLILPFVSIRNSTFLYVSSV